MTISHRMLLIVVVCFHTHFSWFGIAQGLETGSEVTLWVESDQAVATSPLSGRREFRLEAQERVISSGANGINGIVVTSRRLLGFSSRSLTWS